MSRRSIESIEKAKNMVHDLDSALYHAAHDYPGGVPVLAMETGKSATSLSNNLDLQQPERKPTLDQFLQICKSTQDLRILASVANLFDGIAWFETLDSGYSEEKLLRMFNALVGRVSNATTRLEESLSDDGLIDDEEWPVLLFEFQQLLGIVHGIIHYSKTRRIS